jgi:hypothetical protein
VRSCQETGRYRKNKAKAKARDPGITTFRRSQTRNMESVQRWRRNPEKVGLGTHEERGKSPQVFQREGELTDTA